MTIRDSSFKRFVQSLSFAALLCLAPAAHAQCPTDFMQFDPGTCAYLDGLHSYYKCQSIVASQNNDPATAEYYWELFEVTGRMYSDCRTTQSLTAGPHTPKDGDILFLGDSQIDNARNAYGLDPLLPRSANLAISGAWIETVSDILDFLQSPGAPAFAPSKVYVHIGFNNIADNSITFDDFIADKYHAMLDDLASYRDFQAANGHPGLQINLLSITPISWGDRVRSQEAGFKASLFLRDQAALRGFDYVSVHEPLWNSIDSSNHYPYYAENTDINNSFHMNAEAYRTAFLPSLAHAIYAPMANGAQSPLHTLPATPSAAPPSAFPLPEAGPAILYRYAVIDLQPYQSLSLSVAGSGHRYLAAYDLQDPTRHHPVPSRELYETTPDLTLNFDNTTPERKTLVLCMGGAPDSNYRVATTPISGQPIALNQSLHGNLTYNAPQGHLLIADNLPAKSTLAVDFNDASSAYREIQIATPNKKFTKWKTLAHVSRLDANSCNLSAVFQTKKGGLPHHILVKGNAASLAPQRLTLTAQYNGNLTALPNDGVSDHLPVIASDGKKQVVMAWYRTPLSPVGAPTQLVWSYSKNAGKSWTAPAAIYSSADPSTAIRTDDRQEPPSLVYASGVWAITFPTETEIKCFELPVGSFNWIAGTIPALPNTTGEDDYAPALSFSPHNNQLIATWMTRGSAPGNQGMLFMDLARGVKPPLSGSWTTTDLDFTIPAQHSHVTYPRTAVNTDAVIPPGGVPFIHNWLTQEMRPDAPLEVLSYKPYSGANALNAKSFYEVSHQQSVWLPASQSPDFSGRWLTVWSMKNVPVTDADFEVFYSLGDASGQFWTPPAVLNPDALIDTKNDFPAQVLYGGKRGIRVIWERTAPDSPTDVYYSDMPPASRKIPPFTWTYPTRLNPPSSCRHAQSPRQAVVSSGWLTVYQSTDAGGRGQVHIIR